MRQAFLAACLSILLNILASFLLFTLIPAVYPFVVIFMYPGEKTAERIVAWLGGDLRGLAMFGVLTAAAANIVIDWILLFFGIVLFCRVGQRLHSDRERSQ
jgi:hypothetical protein